MVIVRNSSIQGFEIGEQNIKTFRPKVVFRLRAQKKKSVVSSFVKYALSLKENRRFKQKAQPWQKLIEPMLNVDDKTQYCVIRTSFR